MSEGLEVARLFLSDQVPIVLTQSKAMAADPPKALTTAATRLPLTGEGQGQDGFPRGGGGGGGGVGGVYGARQWQRTHPRP